MNFFWAYNFHRSMVHMHILTMAKRILFLHSLNAKNFFLVCVGLSFQPHLKWAWAVNYPRLTFYKCPLFSTEEGKAIKLEFLKSVNVTMLTRQPLNFFFSILCFHVFTFAHLNPWVNGRRQSAK